MFTRTLLARCAPIAIAASAALPAIPAAAQDTTTASPVIVLPPTDPAPVAAPAPAPSAAIVLPQTTSPEANPETAGDTESTSPVATTRVAPRTTAPRSASAPSPAVADSAIIASPPSASAVPSSAQSLPAVAAPKAVSAQAVTQPVATDGGTDEALIAGLLGALGLAAVGGIAFAASRRRRRHADPMLDDAVAEPVAYEPVSAAPPPSPVSAQPVAVAGMGTDRVFQTPVVPAAIATSSAGLARTRPNGDPIPLPANMPNTFEERDALLKDLVAAEPDRANPFTSVRARARRAKLIMQSLGDDFQNRKPRIDLSEYTNRWPALRGWQPATA